MPAKLKSPFGTSYQRIIMEQLQNSENSWFPSFGGTSLILTKLFNTNFTLVFTGTNLGRDASGDPFGSVTGIKISTQTPSGPLELANITGLNIPDLAAFNVATQALDLGEPNFALALVAAFYNAVTPNVINGSTGKDIFEWGTESVTINAGKGNDVVIAGPGGGTINMGPGKKDAIDFRNLTSGIEADLTTGTVTSGPESWTLAGTRIIFGTDFADVLNGSAGNDRIFGRDAADKIKGLGGDDKLYGDDGDDVIRGGKNNDKLWGQKDDDKLFGNSGKDLLFGGAGNDKLWGGDNGDALSGGKGRDNLQGGKGQDTLSGGDGKDTLSGGANGDTLSGGRGADNLLGDGGADELRGGQGDDNLEGEGGRDKLWGDTGDDTLRGGAGNDILNGGAGNDDLWGGIDNDTLRGDGGDDYLRGVAGKNKLEGGMGDDIMDGGSGRDQFIFKGTDLGNDEIFDFEKGVDQIRIFGQTAVDVSIVKVSTFLYLVTHAQGTIEVDDITQSFTIDDITFL